MDSCDGYDECDVYDDNHNGYDDYDVFDDNQIGYNDWLVKGLKSLFASAENNLWIPLMNMRNMMFIMVQWHLQTITCGFL